MTDILFYSTLVLNFSGLLFSFVYLWINVFRKFEDTADRSSNVLTIARVSMVTSILFAFLTCLLTDFLEIEDAISRSALLYSIIAITWLAIIAVCGITMLFTVMSKKYYKREISYAIKSLFKTSLLGSIICLVLTWLFS